MIIYSKLTAIFNYLYLLSVLLIFTLVLLLNESGAGLLIIPFFVSAPIVCLYNLIYLTIFLLRRKQLSFAKHRRLFITSIIGASIVLVIQVFILILFISGVADSRASIRESENFMRRFDECRTGNSLEYCQKKLN